MIYSLVFRVDDVHARGIMLVLISIRNDHVARKPRIKGHTCSSVRMFPSSGKAGETSSLREPVIDRSCLRGSRPPGLCQWHRRLAVPIFRRRRIEPSQHSTCAVYHCESRGWFDFHTWQPQRLHGVREEFRHKADGTTRFCFSKLWKHPRSKLQPCVEPAEA